MFTWLAPHTHTVAQNLPINNLQVEKRFFVFVCLLARSSETWSICPISFVNILLFSNRRTNIYLIRFWLNPLGSKAVCIVFWERDSMIKKLSTPDGFRSLLKSWTHLPLKTLLEPLGLKPFSVAQHVWDSANPLLSLLFGSPSWPSRLWSQQSV